MARIDRVRESYEQITERLFSDKTAFEQYLKFAGKFFKVSSEQSMTIYGTNPNATMVADFDTWKKFSRRVKRGTNSIAVLDNGSLKHYFDISQTAGSSIPYQWTLDKETANAIIAETFENEGKHFSSFSGCVNYLGSEKAHESLDSVVRSLNISAENRTAFEKSYISMVQYLIAARCELGGSFKYNGNVDLTALDMLHSKAEKEKLCEFVQLTGKSVLLSMEKSIHNIELQRRTIDNGRNQADLVRGGQDVLSRNQGGERQAVQAGQGNVRVSGTVGAGSDGRGTGADERADRSLGRGMAEVYDGKSPRSNSVPEGSAEMGADTPTDRQGGLGVSDAPAETVRTEKSPSDNIRGDSEMGEHSRNDSRPGDNRGYSSSVSGVSDNNGATYSTENNEQTAEENSPAVSVSEDSSDLLSALRQHREIFFEDEPEQMITNANSGRATNLRVAFDEDLGKFILCGDYHRNVEVIESAWLSDKSTAEEMEQLIKQNGYKIRGYGDLTEEKSPETQAESKAAETPKRERSESEAADLRYIEEKTRAYLRSKSEKSALYPYILSEMDKNSALAETTYSKAFAYCYEEKIMLKDVPDEDLTEIITAAVEERANKLWENIPLDTLKDIDKFYVNEENESVIWAYFNPDSSAGGQLVYHTFTYDQLFEAIVKNEPMDYLEQVSKTELVDVTEPNFKSVARDFLEDNESFTSRDEDMGAKLSALVEPRYGIFQLKNGDNLRDYRFMSTDSLKKDGLYVDRENYDRVYRGRLREGETLDDIYQRFNINHPEDFRGHSLSVSDVICVKQNGKTTAHYVDSFGFTEVPDFTLSREERKARRTLTDNLTLLADNQLASDEMDTLGDKLFRYDEAPKYRGSSNSWLIGAGMTADKFEDITTRYHNGEDVRAELAKGMYDNMTHIEFYEFPPADGIRIVDISTEKTESGMTFRTKGGFEITHSWETLGEALITAARQEFDRHEELDRQYREQEEKAKAAKAPYVTVEPFSNVDFAKIGLDSEKHYTIPEFNEALANADKLYTADENNSLRVDTFAVTLHIGEKNYHYRPMLGAEYGTLSAIMDDSSLVNSSNISITTQEKELVAEIERIAQVRAFKEKTAANFSSINGFNSADIETMVRDYVQDLLESNDINAKIVDLAVVGSRSRRLESDSSDLDIAIEFTSDLKEDALFNILHNEPFEIGGVTVDINPIRKEETGTLGAYLENAEKTIFENHERKAAENSRENSVTAYRVGDFYEFFAEDAQTTSDLLNLTIVKRQDVPMTGVPFHAFEDYKAKLAAQGYDVKIGDNLELEKLLILKREERVNPRFESIFLDEAKERINEYTQREFGENADYTDLSHVPLAYTTHEETEAEISVYANLSEKTIVTMYGGEIAEKELFDSNEEMLGALGNLDFDELVAVDEDVVKRLTNAKEKNSSQSNELTKNNDDGTPELEWKPLPESIDESTGKPSIWSTEINSEEYGRYLWITKNEHGTYDVEYDTGRSGYGSIMPISSESAGLRSLSDAMDWAQDWAEENGILQVEKISESKEIDQEEALKDGATYSTISNAETEGVQLNLFGDPMSENEAPEKRIIGGVDIEEALKYELIHYGTGFQDGKFRVEQFFREHGNDTTEFAKFLAKEYGTGGHSCEGKVDMSWHDSKGIKLDFILDSGEKTSVTWSWQKIASRLAVLIENQTYITQKDIDDRIRNAQYYVGHYDTDDIQYQRGMKVLEEYGLLDNAREEQAPDRAAETEQKETVSNSHEKSEADEPTTEITEIKNLVQLKRALVVGAEFEITSAFRPEVANQLRKVNYADTTGIYSIRPDAPDDRVTLANNGRGSYLAWGKSADWSFENGSCTAYQKGSEHIPDNVVFTLKVNPRVIEKEHTEEQKQAPEQDNSAPKLKDIVIDLTPRREREEIPVEKHDYTITNENLGVGGAKTKFAANIAAIRTLKTIEAENRLAAPDEQATLAQYVGWGGLAQAFDENNAQWANEFKQLREMLTDEEYAAAKGSVLNAHYTTPTVINAIYKGLENLGFEGGNILEPAMGVGNFFGTMPEEMRQNSHLHGVELDSISGRIARQLYQTADIQIKGFEKTEFSDNFFDAAVGNVPFGSYGVSDKRYNRENFFIHDYFLAKTLDKLAPGGVAALITTKGTLDKENPKVREYLARRGDLIGAIRLPNNAFKANAGTEVTTDILFFQKREKMAVEMPDWCYISKNSEGVPVNSYFLDHPEMILGEMKQGMEFSLYGNASETACVPIEGADLKEQLEAAVATLKLNNALRKHTEQREKEAGIISATEDVRNFTFAEVDGKMYFRENNIMTEVTETGKRLDRIKALNELRSTFRGLLSAQEENCSDEQLAALQAKLNTQYDRFVKEYGYINDSANGQIFGKDDDYNSLCALEIIDEEKKTIEKSDFFTKRTVKYTAEITHVDTPQEAMQVSIDTRGKMDISYMAQLCGQEPQQVIDVLKADNLIYLNPLKTREDNPLEGWEEASEYLSGNVREKLRTAELYAKDNPDYQRNVAALTSVIPPKLEAGDISARIGVSWVDVEDYQQFLTEYAKSRFFEPMRRTITGEYKIENKNWDTSASAIQIYGTSRMPAKAIFENLLNNRDIVVRDKITDPDGREHYEINKKETDLAQEKARQMKEAFKRWLWEDPARREKYVERYNNLFNCIVGRKFDGSHQTFPGMSPSISLKPHQLDAVMRAKFGGNTLLAHCVGAGKSFEMVAATMEKKRLGLINKACIVVPKHLVGQMANEWLRLYPQAKILTATEKDFDKNHRQKFIGRCCTGDYDAVIMSYEQFEKIPMSMEYRQNFIQREIDTMQSGIDELSGDYRSRTNNRSSIKDLEREKKRLEARLEKLIEGGGKTKDTSLTFEQLGFDSLVVDEAHNYKNGLVVSKMNRVSGVQTTPAQKSEDILMKTQFLNENYGEKNIIFATGTPVSNSMTELYIMQRYLRPSLLENAGLQTFDDWASNFGEVVSKAELKPAGNGYRTKKRFAKFNNVPELMQMYKEFADIRTADMLDLPVPEIEGGKPQTIVAKPNDVQKAYMQVLAERSEAIHSGSVDPSVDNMLKITNEARLLGLDARCIMPNAENYPDSKVNLCIDKVMEIYQQTAEQKGVQAIFCDIAVNSDDGRFSVYDYIKEELVRRGVPEEEICAAGDAETQKQRNEMYAQLRSGTKRIVLASTSKMGTGANIQTKLAALHNLDIPWKPSDIEQRNGRIIRQGNEFGKVGVYNYVTENTFDAYLMNIIVTKQRFISQLMNGKATARSCEDVDEAVLNYSEMQALASGDERIKEKIELDGDVARLRLLESEHYNSQYRLEDTIKNSEKWINNFTANIEAAKTDIAFAAEHKPQNDEFNIEIGGKVYTERKAAGEAIQKAAIKAMAEVGGELRKPIGTFCGFQLAIEKIHNGFTVGTGISIRHKLTYTTDMDITGDIGNVTRLENLFNKGLDKKLTELEDKLARTQTDLQEAQAAKGKPFEHADELAQKSARLEQLNRELEVGQADEVIMNESEDEVQGNESHGSHEQDNPDNNRPTPPKHKR